MSRLTTYFFSNYRFGLAVSKNPWLTILLSVILCIISTSGNIFWNENTNDAELWTPYGSPVSSKFDFFSLKFGRVFVNWNFLGIVNNSISSSTSILQYILCLNFDLCKNICYHA